ncbi:MAG TPA: thioredoxin domain-containing protein [Bryobacteraceae bacterium]|jgi:protein-disulfide isomerase|nr:thioredoxin domain-containing protein [Bryobacteraceae bacterium]
MKFIATLLMVAAGLTAADKTGFDKATLEAYLRHVELWRPDVGVKVDDAKESKDLPGFLDVAVHLTFNGTTLPAQHYFMSKDGKKIFRADVYDINHNPFEANIAKLDVKGAPSLGPANAPVTVVVFSDFQCPLCRAEAEVIHKEITTAFPDQVRVYFRDFPLESLHNWARQAAVAGRCVYKLNPAAFWDYHDWIYENQTYIGLDNINSKLQEFATAKGLDSMQFSRCLESKSTEPEVNASLVVGQSLQLNATPTLFVNGRKLEGAVPWETLQVLIKMELDHQAAAAAPAAKDDCCTVKIPTIIK